jgi:hypothetical protein
MRLFLLDELPAPLTRATQVAVALLASTLIQCLADKAGVIGRIPLRQRSLAKTPKGWILILGLRSSAGGVTLRCAIRPDPAYADYSAYQRCPPFRGRVGRAEAVFFEVPWTRINLGGKVYH